MPTRKTTTTTGRPAAQRPGGKRATRPGAPAPVPGKGYPPKVKARALKRLAADGATIAAVHRATGVTKSTLSRWASAAGIDLAAGRARTAAATEAITADLKLDVVSRLERIRDYELTALETIAWAEASYAVLVEQDARITWHASMGGPVPMPTGEEAELALGRLKLLREGIVKRDLVGAAGLIVDKLELLTGKATERGELLVRFGIPRPSFATADAEAIDLPPAEA